MLLARHIMLAIISFQCFTRALNSSRAFHFHPLAIIFTCRFLARAPKSTEEVDIDCDMPEVQKRDDDTDLESFEREEKRMEEEAARVSTYVTSLIKDIEIDLSYCLERTCRQIAHIDYPHNSNKTVLKSSIR